MCSLQNLLSVLPHSHVSGNLDEESSRKKGFKKRIGRRNSEKGFDLGLVKLRQEMKLTPYIESIPLVRKGIFKAFTGEKKYSNFQTYFGLTFFTGI